MLTWILIIVGVVALDQATKHLVMNFLEYGDPVVVIPGVFRFNYTENPAAAMGLFEDHRWVFMTVSTIGIIVLFIYLWKFRPDSKLACAALSMIIGGGIGNMIDRCFYNGTLSTTVGKKVVIDFLDFYAFPDIWSYIFNVADAFVCIGAGILMAWCVYSLVIEIRAEKAKKVLTDSAVEENAPEDTEEKQ